MKHLIVVVFITINFVFFYHEVKSQTDTLENFMLYEASNDAMRSILQDAVNMADDCPFFSVLKKKYYVTLRFSNSDVLSVMIFPHNVTTISMDRNYENLQCDGVCFFDNQIFYIQDFSHTNKLKNYFVQKDTFVNLYFDRSENFLDHIYPANVYIETSYIAQKGGFIKNEDDVDIEARCGLNNRIEFDYIVKHGDTWESIARKCYCDEKNLREEYPEYEDPIPGFMITVSYIFDKYGNFLGVKRPY